MKILSAFGEAVLASAFATLKLGRVKPKPLGEVGALPSVPEGSKMPASSKGKPHERERLIRDYDRAFAQLLSRHGQESMLEALERIRLIIYELSPDVRAWTGELRIRVYMLMMEMAKGLDDPAYAQASLALLVLILSKGGKSALEMARPIFWEKMQAMYHDSRHENERFLPRLMLMLEDYDPKQVETMAKEAIHVWGDTRFSASRDYLGFEELRERGLRNNLRDMLGGEIAKAGLARDMTALDRAVELYHEVK